MQWFNLVKGKSGISAGSSLKSEKNVTGANSAPVTASWPTATWRASLAPKGSVCCLAWTLSPETEAWITVHQLEEFHQELDAIASMLGATPLNLEGSQGIFLCEEAVKGVQTPADTAIMLGQQLCRWAIAADPPIGIRVGAHMGPIRAMTFTSGRDVYVGQALTAARHLAERCPRDGCIYFLKVTKNSLARCARMPLTKFGEHAFLLEVATDLMDDSKSSAGSAHSQQVGGTCSISVNLSLRSDTVPGTFVWRDSSPDILEQKRQQSAAGTVTLVEFKELLEKHNVDLTNFGTGAAKSVEDFYNDTCVSHRSRLVEAEGGLERSLELVRINLVAKDPKTGSERMLRIATEVLEDGRMRTRNQKLAQVVTKGSTWEEAIAECFAKKLGIAEDVQSGVFLLDMTWLKKERQNSASFPGITTVYLTHEVRVRVTDTTLTELAAIGLPNFTNFSTNFDGLRATWTWTLVGEQSTHEDILSATLQEHNVDISAFKEGGFEDLLDEIYRSKLSSLVMRDGELQRHLQIIKVWLCAEILSIPYVLVIRSKIQNGKRDFRSSNRPISMRMVSGQSWDEALRIILLNRLALDEDFQAEHLLIDEGSYKVREEVADSETFSGLTTVYQIHEVQVQVKGSMVCPTLGLPDGHEFAFSRVEGKGGGGGGSKGSSNTTITYFCWKSRKELIEEKHEALRHVPASFPRPYGGDVEEVVPDEKRRLPVVPPKFAALPQPAPKLVLPHLMKGQTTDWVRAWNAAKRIRDRDYTLRLFYEDCVAAFPELQLYIYDQNNPSTTSGRSADDEYQRTLGALFAVYWLVRYDMDGAQAFTYGVGSNWMPLEATSTSPVRSEKEKRMRELFILNMQWDKLHNVLASAGLLTPNHQQDLKHYPERVLAMLVLTAIHDVMKVAALAPTVDAKHCSEWSGYKVGEAVLDHDAGLAYYMEFMPESLPSYQGLPKEQQESVKFTQCKMDYNMGWLVQAEAPPGALFRTFRSMIRGGQASSADVAFYFTHWLTDLAGAEPFPLEGCEKFVLKFPQKVLLSFLDSFPVVQNLSTKTETEVLEDYLAWRWKQIANLGPIPQGRGSIAKQRLVVMAQGSADLVLGGLDNLITKEDQDVLYDELARTGCSNTFLSEGKPSGPIKGPAILVYYSPALMQKNAASDCAGALSILAEVLRRSRVLWPLSTAHADETVTVRIDAIKELDATTMLQLDPGEVWVLQRTSQKDAQVRRVAVIDKEGCPTDIDWSENRTLYFGARSEAVVDVNVGLFEKVPEELDSGGEGNGKSYCGDVSIGIDKANVCRWCMIRS